MARKTTPSWFQVFQKPKSELEHPPERDDSPILLSDDPASPTEPPPTIGHGMTRFRNGAATATLATRATARRIKPILRAWKWQLIWLGILGIFGGTGALAFLWLSKVPPAVDCNQVSVQSLESEQLFCAQQAAQSGKPEQLIASINLVKDWSTEHPLYGQSRLLLQDWSNALLMVARDRVSQRDVKGAVALANQIPPNSPSYKDARSAIDRWQAEYRRGEAIYAKVQDALKKQNWDKASEQIAQLSLVNDPGWQDRLGEIRTQSNNEKAAWKFLQDAREFAKSNPKEQWGKAIALTDPINRKTYVWSLQAQQEVTRWRNTIFGLAIAQLDQQNVSGASELINSLPNSVQLTSANRDLVRLVRGREAEIGDGDYRAPGLERIASIMMASYLVKQIDEQSPFYSRAKSLIPRLERQMQGLTQLGIASTIANLQQVPALNVAIAQAKAIPPKHPGRLQAQTLLAQWQKEVETMQDRPVITRSRQVAKSGKLAPLRSAVALASLVKPQRALRVEAQTDIAAWTYQIQVIEDRPILNNARAIAKTGQYGQAIDVASKIAAGRALYSEAQSAIGEWVYEIQIIEDRPILAQASALANQGYLTRAISVASGIAPGRALYGEAQGLIGRWAAERAEIWRQRDAAPIPPAQQSPPPVQDPTPQSLPEPTP